VLLHGFLRSSDHFGNFGFAEACGTKQWDRQDQKSRVEGFLFHQNDFHFIVYIDIRKWKTNTTISVQK
jgi:hypothetical protein